MRYACDYPARYKLWLQGCEPALIHPYHITPDRNALGDDLIEALECLKAWWDNGLVLRH
jgi:hypothetical protein